MQQNGINDCGDALFYDQRTMSPFFFTFFGLAVLCRRLRLNPSVASADGAALRPRRDSPGGDCLCAGACAREPCDLRKTPQHLPGPPRKSCGIKPTARTRKWPGCCFYLPSAYAQAAFGLRVRMGWRGFQKKRGDGDCHAHGCRLIRRYFRGISRAHRRKMQKRTDRFVSLLIF